MFRPLGGWLARSQVVATRRTTLHAGAGPHGLEEGLGHPAAGNIHYVKYREEAGLALRRRRTSDYSRLSPRPIQTTLVRCRISSRIARRVNGLQRRLRCRFLGWPSPCLLGWSVATDPKSSDEGRPAGPKGSKQDAKDAAGAKKDAAGAKKDAAGAKKDAAGAKKDAEKAKAEADARAKAERERERAEAPAQAKAEKEQVRAQKGTTRGAKRSPANGRRGPANGRKANGDGRRSPANDIIQQAEAFGCGLPDPYLGIAAADRPCTFLDRDVGGWTCS